MNVTYSYTLQNRCLLRGKGLKEHKDLIASYGFVWVFKKKRRFVAAYEAILDTEKLTELLLKLKHLGCNVTPNKSLPKDRHINLKMPSCLVKIMIKQNDNFGFEKFVNWLNENGYSKIENIEEQGDFSVKGENVIVWTFKKVIRISFRHETIDSIYCIDEKSNIQQVPSIEIRNIERVEKIKVENSKPLMSVKNGDFPTFHALSIETSAKKENKYSKMLNEVDKDLIKW